MRTPPSLPNHLPKATPPNTVTFQGQDVIGELWGTQVSSVLHHLHPLNASQCQTEISPGTTADTPNTGIAIPLLGHHATVALKDVHSQTYKYDTLRSKRDFADVIKLKILT